MKRLFFDILLFLSIFLLPWWYTAILAMVGLFVFMNFYEFLATGIIIFILSTVPNLSIISSSTLFYLSIGVFYLLIQSLKDRIILYKNNNVFPHK